MVNLLSQNRKLQYEQENSRQIGNNVIKRLIISINHDDHDHSYGGLHMGIPERYWEGYDAGYQASIEKRSLDPAKSRGWHKQIHYPFKLQEEEDAFETGWHHGYQTGKEKHGSS